MGEMSNFLRLLSNELGPFRHDAAVRPPIRSAFACRCLEIPLPTFTGRVRMAEMPSARFFLAPFFWNCADSPAHPSAVHAAGSDHAKMCLIKLQKCPPAHAAVKGTKLRNRALQQRFNRGNSPCSVAVSCLMRTFLITVVISKSHFYRGGCDGSSKRSPILTGPARDVGLS